MSEEDKNVLLQLYENALVAELERIKSRVYISKEKIEEVAIEKYRSNGYGITFKDVITKFSIKKPQAQRSLKHFHSTGVLFTAEDLICQGIELIENTSPQQYFPACIKADIIEDLKKRKNVLVEPTRVNLSKDSLNPYTSSPSPPPPPPMHTLSKTLEYQV